MARCPLLRLTLLSCRRFLLESLTQPHSSFDPIILQRATILTLHLNATADVFEKDAGRRLIDLLPSRARTLHKALDKILFLKAQSGHARLENGIFNHRKPKRPPMIETVKMH